MVRAMRPLEDLESPRLERVGGKGRTSVVTPRRSALSSNGPRCAAINARRQSGCSRRRLAIISSRQISAPPSSPEELRYWIFILCLPDEADSELQARRGPSRKARAIQFARKPERPKRKTKSRWPECGD